MLPPAEPVSIVKKLLRRAPGMGIIAVVIGPSAGRRHNTWRVSSGERYFLRPLRTGLLKRSAPDITLFPSLEMRRAPTPVIDRGKRSYVCIQTLSSTRAAEPARAA
jgi:hypothetical protein